ncbi:MAG: TrmB family transcriptional regulator [Candidatus Hadarchaeaceae archaeon]
MIDEEKLSVLRGLGLTEYEAKTYVALTSVRSAVPREVAGLAGIPYPSTYDALEALVKKGWVEVARGRPRRYRARSPDLIQKESVATVERVFGELEKIYRSSMKRAETPEIIYTIVGRTGVIKKIQEVLSRAEKEVIIVLPNYEEFASYLDQIFNSLIGKGVKIRLTTESEVSLKNIEVRLRKPILAVDVLVDEKEAIIGLPNYSACGWVENPVIAKHFKEFLELLWKSSKTQ